MALVAVHTSLVMIFLDNWTPSFCTTTINIRYHVTYSCKCQIWTHRVAFTKSFVKDILYVWSFFSFGAPILRINNVVDPGRTAISISTTYVLLNDSQMERDTFVSFSKLMSRLKRSDMVNILINFNSNKKMF